MEDQNIKSVNWHVTSKCNYNCKFCHTKDSKSEITEILDAGIILSKLKAIGIEKVNFLGGEPLLYPFIYDIIKTAKRMGFVTSITTNGSLLTPTKVEMFSPYLDWIGIPVDSKSDLIERKMGRGCGKHLHHIQKISGLLQNTGIKLKINTIVTFLNYKEDLRPFVKKLNPDKWNVFLSYDDGKCDDSVSRFSITNEDFKSHIRLNEKIVLKSGEKPIFQRCEDIMNTCLILSATGNIYIKSKNIDNINILEYNGSLVRYGDSLNK